jgi:hypothetical protein
MQNPIRFTLVAAALLLAPLSLAEEQSAAPASPTAAASVAEPATRAEPAVPAAPAAVAPAAVVTTVASAPGACRTRKDVGEACACVSNPDTVGAAQAAPDGGRNMCVVASAR